MEHKQAIVQGIVENYKSNETISIATSNSYNDKIQALYRQISELQKEQDAAMKPLNLKRDKLRFELATIDSDGEFHDISFSINEKQMANQSFVSESAKSLELAKIEIVKIKRRMDENRLFEWIEQRYPNLTSDDNQTLWETFLATGRYIHGM